MKRTLKMLKHSTGATLLGLALAFGASAGDLRADGCYICAGQPNTYVKFTGSDSGAKRTAAKNCGCTVSGTRGSCNAANFKILCTVMKEKAPNQSVAHQSIVCVKPGS